MADGENSGLAKGTSGAPQFSLENEEIAEITKRNEERNARYKYDHDEIANAVRNNNIDFLINNLAQSSPILIPDTATVVPSHKDKGYEQVRFLWTQGQYKYESRWHTHTPNAPDYSQDTWVVTRTLPGIPAGNNHREKVMMYLIKEKGWVSSIEWDNAKRLRKLNKETEDSRRLLDNGHWKAE